MGTSVATRAARYRLVYVQPDPDNGERVCVGVMFEEPDQRLSVLYDLEFSKVRCVAPDLDISMLRFYVEDFVSNLRHTSEPDLVLKRYSPQLTTSDARLVVHPVSETLKQQLFTKFAKSGGRQEEALPLEAVTARKERETTHRIREFFERIATPFHLSVIPDARPQDVFGIKASTIKPVAIGIKDRSRVLLVDGIDLNTLSPTRGVTRTNRVVHTFWQYKRLHDEDLMARQTRLQRVAVIMNGASTRSRSYLEAHDYALDQFRRESDLLIDSSSSGDAERLQALLGAE